MSEDEAVPVDMRARILETGAHMFVSRGFDGVSMREIADACGISNFVQAVFMQLPVKESAMIWLAKQEMGKINPPAREEFIIRYQRDFIDRLAAFVQEGIRSGESRDVDPHLVVWGLLGVMYPFLNSGSVGRRQTPEQVVDFIQSLFLYGVAARGG